MKQFWTIILCLFLVTGMTAFFTACSKADSEQTGGQEPEPEPEPEDDAEPLSGAYGIYLGGDMDPEVGHYLLAIWSEGVVFDEGSWLCTGNGEFIWLDMSASIAEDLKNIRLAAGDYAAADFETFEEFTFQRGMEDMGSFLGTVVDDEETIDPISDGTLTIETKGAGYAVRLTVKTESGEERTFKFDGEIPVGLFGIGYGPDPFSGTFTGAAANYYGDDYGVGFGNIQLILTDIETLNGQPWIPGHTLYLDVNTPIFSSQSDIGLAAGVYSCAKSGSYAGKTFNPGEEDEDGNIYGSLWVETRSDGTEEPIYRVTDGSFTVSGNGMNSKVTVNVKLDNGETRTGEYNGVLRVEDRSCLSRLTGDVTTTFTKGRAMFFGDAQYYQNNSYHWVIAVATSGVDLNDPGNPATKGEMLQLAINTTRDSKTEIPSGNYEVMEGINGQYLVPFSYLPGYIDDNRGVNGTWYFKDTKAMAPAVGGMLKIENKGNNNYVIEYDFVDDYYYAPGPHRITGKFEGALLYSDYSDPYGAPAKAKQAAAVRKQGKFKAQKAAVQPARRVARR